MALPSDRGSKPLVPRKPIVDPRTALINADVNAGNNNKSKSIDQIRREKADRARAAELLRLENERKKEEERRQAEKDAQKRKDEQQAKIDADKNKKDTKKTTTTGKDTKDTSKGGKDTKDTGKDTKDTGKGGKDTGKGGKDTGKGGFNKDTNSGSGGGNNSGARLATGGNILKDIETTVTNTVDDNAAEVMDLYTQFLYNTNPNGGKYDYTPLEKMATTMPKLMSAEDLAKLYGLDYNLANITDTLMKGVDTAYKTRYQDQTSAENKYYDNAAVTQNTLANTLDNMRSQAIMSGTNKGMQAANALSAVLGTSQQFAGSATQLAQDRQKLSTEYAAAQAKTNADALNTYNAMGADLADLSKSNYSSDTSRYVGQLDYNTGVNTVNGQLAAQKMASQAGWDSNLASVLGSIYGQYMNQQGGIEQSRIGADATLGAANINAGATRDAAQLSKEATEYATDNQKTTTYGSTTTDTGIGSGDILVNGVVNNLAEGSVTDPNKSKDLLDAYLKTGQITQQQYSRGMGYITSKINEQTKGTGTTDYRTWLN